MKLKTGDKVVVISGSNKGKEGTITRVLDEKVIVEGINIVTKHVKPKNNNGTGEIIKVEAPIHVSNVKVEAEEKKAAKKTTKKSEKKAS